MSTKNVANRLSKLSRVIIESDLSTVRGIIKQINGPVLKVTMPNTRIGNLCYLMEGDRQIGTAEVVGFDHPNTLLSVLSHDVHLSTYITVVPTDHPMDVKVGDKLIGQILDGFGNPINPDLEISNKRYSVTAKAPDPMSREIITEPIGLGVKAIDGLLTCGKGQRVGIFAAAGVGKSTLLSMICANTEADIIVIGLVGERGREVREFIEHTLGTAGMAKSVVVMATSDKSAMERAKCPQVATSVAEYFRDCGKKVLLFIDSITRYARALREVGLAAGEAPVRRGYPVSVFFELSKLLERTGNSDKGSITALYTVLVEGDDMNEPIADEVRSILDGHLILSRELASAGHYPAIDILKSVSRVMPNIISEEHLQASINLRALLAKYKEIELLIQLGEYEDGSDTKADQAIQMKDMIDDFLKQPIKSKSSYQAAVQYLVDNFS